MTPDEVVAQWHSIIDAVRHPYLPPSLLMPPWIEDIRRFLVDPSLFWPLDPMWADHVDRLFLDEVFVQTQLTEMSAWYREVIHA